MSAIAISIDQFHWVHLAQALKRPSADPTYRRTLEVATELRASGRVRFPLSTDRYHETLRVADPSSRIDRALVMALLSGYETTLQLDLLSSMEIGDAIARLADPSATPGLLPVFGEGALHAFGRQSLANGLRIKGLDGVLPASVVEFLTEQMRAVAQESYARQFEWSVLSGDPRVSPLDPTLHDSYNAARANFAAEEQRRLAECHANHLNPRKYAYAAAFASHVDEVVRWVLRHGVEMADLPLDKKRDSIPFMQSIPTVHVLAELLTSKYGDSTTIWKDTDWADMRMLCVAIPYCDVVAPDRDWAHHVLARDLPADYGTVVLRDKAERLTYLDGLL